MSGCHDSTPWRAASAMAAALLVVGVALSGCSALGGITGAVAGAASGTASGNPGVGIAVAIGVKTAIDAGQRTFDRYWHQEEQQSIAEQIGALDVGAQGPWQVRHIVPYEDNQGRVRVLRAFKTALADCKEALFTVEDEEGTDPADAQLPQHYLTTVCRGAQGWRWALAEPAVGRWGTLH